MVTRGESDEESDGRDSQGRESSMSGEESDEQVRYPSDETKGKIAGYEKQRLSRIAENKIRMEALGIYKAANALMGSSSASKKCRRKRNSGEEDDDYRPGDENDDDDENDGGDVEFLGNTSSGFRKRKVKNNRSVSKRKVLFKKNMKSLDTPESDENDSEDELKKAIALSLQDSVTGGGWKKEKPLLMSGTQMTDDELVIYFYEFDEAGKGLISGRDVEKMARVHDFTWTQEELEDMIRCFDIDKDGKLSLDEFRKIVTRCRMLKQA